ncbi:MAG: DUF2927 domain-containing protein [Tabrizicola sp.]|nr:DUF2927 domain-containing protein [Tabrizicola sp.]
MIGSAMLRTARAGVLCLSLVACDMAGIGGIKDHSDDIPLQPAQPTPRSAAAKSYYAQVQATLLREGLLRTDPGSEIPVSPETLAANFLKIALFDEYRRESTGFVPLETASELRRWAQPIRVGLRFGSSVPADRQETDRVRMASLIARLSLVTGHPMVTDDLHPNFWVYIVSEDEREALEPQIRAVLPGLTPGDIAGITRMPRSTYCLVYAASAGGDGAYTQAFAVIRAEHPDLLRLSCMHEELAQGLGLPNDSPEARPSIFNDDEEFALLTDQDELLLRMLYSPELRPGMLVAEARPIVLSLARRLLGGDT